MVDRVYQRNVSESAPQPPSDPQTGYPTAGNPAQGVPPTVPGPYWFHMITESLRRVVVEAGLTPDHTNLGQVVEALQAMGLGAGQFQPYLSTREYETGDVVRGSDGLFYEFYDRDQTGTTQGADPTNAANRPHIWMKWDGVRPGSTIEWRSTTLPEGYVVNQGGTLSRIDYRRIFAALGTTYGSGNGTTTFGMPDDRGEFKRGLDQGRGIDPGRSISAHQLDQMQRITGEHGGNWASGSSQPTAGAFLSGVPTPGVTDRASSGSNQATTMRFDSIGSPNARVSSTTSGETRSRNNAVIYLTKI